jgi:hypothetical protein
VSSKHYNERIKVIHACVRRAVYTDPKLLVVAQNYKTVMALLTDSTLDVRIVETLWNAIRHLGMHEVRAAIGTSPGRSWVLVQIQLSLEDVLRPKNDPGEYASVLGGRVYKALSNRSLPFRAWGHMTAVFMCYTCARRVCKTVSPCLHPNIPLRPNHAGGGGSHADALCHIAPGRPEPVESPIRDPVRGLEGARRLRLPPQ